jgi:hypothetical protein
MNGLPKNYPNAAQDRVNADDGIWTQKNRSPQAYLLINQLILAPKKKEERSSHSMNSNWPVFVEDSKGHWVRR